MISYPNLPLDEEMDFQGGLYKRLTIIYNVKSKFFSEGADKIFISKHMNLIFASNSSIRRILTFILYLGIYDHHEI